MAKQKLKVGMIVESGYSHSYDYGKVTKVNRDGSVEIHWHISETTCIEDLNDPKICIVAEKK